VGPCVVVQDDAFSEHPGHLFGSTSEAHSAFHNKPLDVIVVPGAMNSVNKIPLLSCVKKTNHSTYRTAGGSSNDTIHISSVITPTLHSENV
jgi:hypothetical protein